jgi:hypothetical protein
MLLNSPMNNCNLKGISCDFTELCRTTNEA